MNATPDREWLFREFRSSLRALAADGEIALANLPKNSARADELALDFDNLRKVAVENFREEFTAEQLDAIAALDKELSEMSVPGNSRLWTDEAVCNHPRWTRVRSLASDALRTLGWQDAG